MNKDKDFETIEALLSGKIKQPSPRFEEALRDIPQQKMDRQPPLMWPAMLKLAGIAAAVSLLAWTGLDINLNDKAPTAERVLQGDYELLTLFTLSNDLDMAEPLLSEDNLAALDYLTSTP